jgi:hypothetical protein
MFRATMCSSSGGQLYEYNFWYNHCVLVAVRYAGQVETTCFEQLCAYPQEDNCINPLNAELNPICHLLALFGVQHILHVSR